MDFWNRARSFAEEAAKRSQELTLESSSKLAVIAEKSKQIAAEATKRSQELTIGGSTFSDIVSETAKRSKEIAAEASKRADQIKAEAMKGADKIKSLAEGISVPAKTGVLVKDGVVGADGGDEEMDLERFGVTDELREFVKEITINTFRDFPLEDDLQISDVPTVSNVRQDLTQFQEKHAKLVLSTVKEISKLRYELCPRFMKERKFWRIYFLLVNTHIAAYETRYGEDLQKEEQVKTETTVETTSKPELQQVKTQLKSSSSSADQDLDVFLLGDLGDSDDGGPDDGVDGFDDDFDKMGDTSDDDKEKGNEK